MAVDLYRAQRVSGYVDLDYLLGADECVPIKAGVVRGTFSREFSPERFESLERWITANCAKVRRDRQRWRPTVEHGPDGIDA